MLDSTSYSITAKENISKGYSITFCYVCEINALGYPPMFFTKDMIIVTQNALDCSTALTDAGFKNPPSIPFKDSGPLIPIIEGYTSIFDHS